MRGGFVQAYKIVHWKNKPFSVVRALSVILSFLLWSFRLHYKPKDHEPTSPYFHYLDAI